MVLSDVLSSVKLASVAEPITCQLADGVFGGPLKPTVRVLPLWLTAVTGRSVMIGVAVVVKVPSLPDMVP